MEHVEPVAESLSFAGRLLVRQDAPRPALRARAVLVVDDDPDAREALSEMLSAWGYLPVTAGSAEAAERLARYYLLDAAVVDVFLPGRSGEQLLGQLRRAFPAAVLVGVSALVDPALERLCRTMGADHFLAKPVSPSALGKLLTP